MSLVATTTLVLSIAATPADACGGSYVDPIGYSEQVLARFGSSAEIWAWEGVEYDETGRRSGSYVSIWISGWGSASGPATVEVDLALAKAHVAATFDFETWDGRIYTVSVTLDLSGTGVPWPWAWVGPPIPPCIQVVYVGPSVSRAAAGTGSISVSGGPAIIDVSTSSAGFSHHIA